MQVLHSCDNPICVNPEHLSLGTHDDNMKDKTARKRIHAERNPRTKLTWEDVRVIRSLYPAMSQPEIAQRYGLKVLAINRIINNRTWKEQ